MKTASKAERRSAFHDAVAPSIVARWNPAAAPWTTVLALSKRFAWFATDEQLLVIGSPVETQRDIDLGLAYGIAHAQDRELVLILPLGTEEPTRIRMPWFDRAIRLATYDDTGDVTEHPPSARSETLGSYDDPIADGDHQLGDRALMVTRLRQWADDCPELIPAHRGSYLAWHCEGRMVLRIRRSRGGVRVSAGVHAIDPPPVEVALKRPVQPEQFHTIVAAASTAIAHRLGGDDSGHVEHRLQQRLAERAWEDLHLGRTLREFPAMRPVGNRAYIDLLGVDASQRLHVVETKIGADPMLVLQGLDYWLWVRAHLPELRTHLETVRRMPTDPASRVCLDFVIAPDDGDWLSPYTAAQLEALSGEIPWRLHRWDHWGTDEPAVTSSGSRQVPDWVARAAPPGFVERAERALMGRADDMLHGKFFPPGAGILPHATPAFDDLGTRDRLHRYVNHVRSSQAFAINLFGGLDPTEALALWATIDQAVTEHDSVDFEYEDPHDELAEAQPVRPHRTQVDVLLRGRDATGTSHVALVEVKLTETTFGGCSAFDSPHNPRRHLCRTPAAWGGDADGCFQLTNHDGPHRRRYDEFIDPAHLGENELPHCPFLEANQVTRNVALAGALVRRGEAATATVVLCAPRGNRAVWRQWERCRTLYARQPDIGLVDLPADVAAAARHRPIRDRIEKRYALTETLA